LIFAGAPGANQKKFQIVLERRTGGHVESGTILDEIKGLTLLEASDLVKKMEETFGVSAAAATVVAAGGGGAAAAAAPAEEKTEFTVVLTDVGGNRSTSLKPFAKSRASA